MADTTSLAAMIGVLALSTTRIAVAFLLLPAFAPEILPNTIRNSVFLSFGMVTLAVQPAMDMHHWTATTWVSLFLKEAFIGASLGLLLGSVLWAFEAAGQVIDTHAGATQSQINDPLSGQQVTLSGAFLGRLANFIFMFSGGFLMWIGCIVESYAAWPVAQLSLNIPLSSTAVFEQAFGQFSLTTLLMAGPAMVLLFTIDVVLGLTNRFAPQLNVYQLASAIKSVAAMLVWLLMLSTLVTFAQEAIPNVIRKVIPTLTHVFGQ